jgi:hypothetical protein
LSPLAGLLPLPPNVPVSPQWSQFNIDIKGLKFHVPINQESCFDISKVIFKQIMEDLLKVSPPYHAEH